MLLSLQLSAEEGIKLNQIQVLGTHNSYHLSKRIQLFPSLNYQHPPLFQQLELGARQLELDLHYHKRKKELYIHHVKMIDGKTHCKKFSKCLNDIREWTDKNPRHSPLLIWLELKDKDYDRFFPVWGKVRKHFDLLEKEILTPDEVRKKYSTMTKAIRKKGWPYLRDIKGKIIFAMISEGIDREEYIKNAPNMAGKLIWVEGTSLVDPYAGFFKGGEYFNLNILKNNVEKIKNELRNYDNLYLNLFQEKAEESYLSGDAFFVERMFKGAVNIDPHLWDLMTKN